MREHGNPARSDRLGVIGCVIDGCPPGIKLAAEDIQAFLDKRRPGQSRLTTQRREPDEVRLGLIPAMISPYVVAAIGPRWATALFTTAEGFDAVFAEKIGLVHYAVDLWGVPVIPAFLLAFAVAAFIGFCNGVIVTKFKVPSLVATLGSYYLLLGVLLTTSHAYPAEIPAAAQGRIQSIFGAADWSSGPVNSPSW